jgi:hypothetical protein
MSPFVSASVSDGVLVFIGLELTATVPDPEKVKPDVAVITPGPLTVDVWVSDVVALVIPPVSEKNDPEREIAFPVKPPAAIVIPPLEDP